MKNISTKIMLFIAAAALCVSINACKKSTTDSDLSTVEDHSQAESESNYIGSTSDAAASNENVDNAPMVARSGGNWTPIPGCASITITDTSLAQKTMTITFNPNCTCADGKTRQGSIIVTWTGRYRDSGTIIRTVTSNYIVNNNPHNYRRTVKNMGHELYNGVEVPYFNVNDTATIIFPAQNNATITWFSARQREWIQGSNDPWFWWDTKYSITGSANGVDRKGIAFTVNITNPIIADFSCYWILTQGTFTVQPQGKALRTIDFGDGSCDDNATCTINGVTYAFQFGNY